MTGGTDRRRDRRSQIAAGGVTLVFALPLVFLFLGSLRPSGEPPPIAPELLPSSFTLANYPGALDQVPLARQFLNSLIVVVVAVPISVVVGWWGAFAITRLGRRPASAMIGVSLVALMIPPTALLVGRFEVFDTLRLTDTLVPLVAPALIATSPLHVLLFVWAIRRIPPELIDTARVEGLSAFQTWRRVVVPMTRRMGVAVGVLSFVATWSNFLDPLVYLSSPEHYTLPLGLKSLARIERSDQPMVLAGAVMATLPVLAAFLCVQRYFVHRPAGLATAETEPGARP